jgi:hypothetical protein
VPHLRLAKFNWKDLTDDERWAIVVTRRSRLLTAMINTPAMNQGLDEGLLKRMRACPPCGYKPSVKSTVSSRWRRCGSPACIFCHARKVASHLGQLELGWNRRPPGAPVFAALMTDVGPRDRRSFLVRNKLLAGGVGFRYPLPGAPGKPPGWVHRLVVLTDNLARIKGCKRLSVTGLGGLAFACARWLGYPLAYDKGQRHAALRRALLATSRLTPKTQLFSTYGVCRSGAAADETKSGGYFGHLSG